MPAAIDLTGKRFGRLVAMHLAPKNEAAKARRKEVVNETWNEKSAVRP